MKRVLLLGDSISVGYREYVKELLKGEAEVVFPDENGRFIKYTFWGLHLWVKELGRPDLIHFNNGLWDVHIEHPHTEELTPLSEYIHYLERMVTQIDSVYGCPVIFATSTPVPDEAIGRSAEQIARYNTAARAVMDKYGVPINDLNALVSAHMEYVSDDLLHLTEEGYRACAQQVAAIIRNYL